MLTDITIGQYFPGRSLLHRLDPRMKLLLTLLYMVAVFLPRNWYGLAAAAGFLLAAVLLSRLPLRLIWRSVKPILFLVLFTSVLNIFYVTGGTTLVHWGFLRVTTQGLITAAFLSARIICLIIGSSLLTYTTTPTALTDAIEAVLRPLKIIRINAHELAMMMTIALRFIPTLMEETHKIMSAQKARGADMESGGLLRRIKALIPVIIPLFISSFRRAYDLAMAMECRCYRGGEGRTRMKRLRTAGRDWLTLTVMLALMIGLFLLNQLGSVLA
ncbi:MAG: energy-coupling factor transporter transmembrane protein EcfT [Ruminococcaceae bacterium]|nr:energy-coupling factor transporter transmembrane protein EcfT [Oscillospiraceae bacterium]